MSVNDAGGAVGVAVNRNTAVTTLQSSINTAVTTIQTSVTHALDKNHSGKIIYARRTTVSLARAICKVKRFRRKQSHQNSSNGMSMHG
jgi:uncharacterized protein YciW